jgi:alpha-aminoadipic semialdehyde synthase
LLENYWENIPVTPKFDLEGLPNRNSLVYAKLYRLGGMRTFVRGTLRFVLGIFAYSDLTQFIRYPGYTSLLHSFKKLGFLNNKKAIYLQGWNTFVRQSMLIEYEREDDFIPSLPQVIPAAQLQSLHDALEWLGLTVSALNYPPPTKQMPPLPNGPETPLSIFAYLLSEKLRYAPNDKDMVVLSHEIITDDSYVNRDFDGPRREQAHTSTLITYGTSHMNVGFQGERPASAMARTVGFPAAIAAMLIAEGKIQLTGVRQPAEREIYQPVLKELEQMGIVMEEKTRRVVRDRGELPDTVEGALGLAVASEEKKRKWKMGAVEDAWNLDLDSDEGWKEEEVVEWSKEYRKPR